MKYYLAPMEGITGYIYRNTYNKFFHNIDKYFSPFIVPNTSTSLKTKEFRDIVPENNEGINIIPQILTNNAEGFVNTCKKLQQLGYKEVNLNLGCPSGTVVSKNRGSGFLAKREELDLFLEHIFKYSKMKISVKTRIGKDSPEEFLELMKIYNKYPMEELIIHPRIQKDFYKNKPNLDVFEEGLLCSENSICYNGDIFNLKDYENIKEKFPKLEKVMLGRGILASPGLIDLIRNGSNIDKKTLKAFHDELLSAYMEVYKDEKNTLFKMKELFSYMMYIFSDNKKYVKKVKKAQKIDEYKLAISNLFENEKIIEGAGLFYTKD